MNQLRTFSAGGGFFGVVSALLVGVLAGCQGPGSTERPLTAQQQRSMQQCAVQCMRTADADIRRINEALASTEQAAKAVEADNAALAQRQIDKAQATLLLVRKTLTNMQQQLPCANVACPMSGQPIDATTVPAERSRMHKGVKVGFGEGADLEVWERLSDAEKEEKILGVVPEGVSSNLFSYTR